MKSNPKTLDVLASTNPNSHLPFRQVQEKVSSRTLGLEARNPEPAGQAVVARAGAARDAVAQNLPPGAGGLQLWRVAQVADDGDAGDGAGRGGAERTGGARPGDGGAGHGAEDRIHFFCGRG
jgi:hypothetical protein